MWLSFLKVVDWFSPISWWYAAVCPCSWITTSQTFIDGSQLFDGFSAHKKYELIGIIWEVTRVWGYQNTFFVVTSQMSVTENHVRDVISVSNKSLEWLFCGGSSGGVFWSKICMHVCISMYIYVCIYIYISVPQKFHRNTMQIPRFAGYPPVIQTMAIFQKSLAFMFEFSFKPHR